MFWATWYQLSLHKKKCCNLIKEDILKVMEEFCSHGVLPKGTNATFLSLTLKNDNPQSLREYRPISLVSSLYKIIAKVYLSGWGGWGVLHKLITKSHSAFLRGRNMHGGG